MTDFKAQILALVPPGPNDNTARMEFCKACGAVVAQLLLDRACGDRSLALIGVLPFADHVARELLSQSR